VKLWVSSGATPLEARTVTVYEPAAVGVQLITPVAESIDIPGTAVSKEKPAGGNPVASTS
jgi:hypothetical protein